MLKFPQKQNNDHRMELELAKVLHLVVSLNFPTEKIEKST